MKCYSYNFSDRVFLFFSQNVSVLMPYPMGVKCVLDRNSHISIIISVVGLLCNIYMTIIVSDYGYFV